MSYTSTLCARQWHDGTAVLNEDVCESYTSTLCARQWHDETAVLNEDAAEIHA